MLVQYLPALQPVAPGAFRGVHEKAAVGVGGPPLHARPPVPGDELRLAVDKSRAYLGARLVVPIDKRDDIAHGVGPFLH